jgi:deoxyxylulose-5-phosphate synthase
MKFCETLNKQIVKARQKKTITPASLTKLCANLRRFLLDKISDNFNH